MGLLIVSGIIITLLWYNTSKKMMDTYLNDISQSTMQDAYQSVEYLLTDTYYMAAIISTNDANIVQPVYNLNNNVIMENGQWNQTYLENRRKILNFINNMNGYKYYIEGITIAAKNTLFRSNYLMSNEEERVVDQIAQLDPAALKKGIVMMEPIELEAYTTGESSSFVIPAVRGIMDTKGEIIGYVVLYFDYGVIEKMFSANLPDGSYFQVVNENGALIYANSEGGTVAFESLGKGYVKNTFDAQNVGWQFSIAIPSDYYLEDIQRTAFVTSGIVAIVFLLVGVIAALMISRMTREITVLNKSMKKIAGGTLEISYKVKSGDEIGEMGRTFNHMVVRIRKLMKRVADEEREKRLNEIAFLQAQINPHFISNVLNNVVWMAKIQHADNIVPLVNSLNALLQNVMHQDKDMIPLETELEHVNHYISIMEYSGSYDFRVERKIEPGTEKLYIPRFILQPIVENAIYHGLPDDLSKQACIRLETAIVGDRLQIIVEDNGAGMSREQIQDILSGGQKNREAFSGIGAANVAQRIHLFLGKAYGLHYESVEGAYTRAIFTLPIMTEPPAEQEKGNKEQEL